MPSKPTASVIVATKNEEKNIARCLLSIKKQNYKGKIEIIVVDNYSTDATVAIAKQYTTSVFIQGNERSSQRNFGAKKSHGKYLFFIDADMEVSKHVIAESISLAEKKLLPSMIIISENSVGTTFWGKALALERNCYKDAIWLQAARVFPRKYFFRIGGYDAKLISGEDWDITQRFRKEGFSAFITNATINHYESKENIVTLLKKESYYIQHIQNYAKKHPHAFSYQGSFLYRGFIWIRSWHTLIQHPLQTTAFILYKFTVWCMWMYHKKKYL